MNVRPNEVSQREFYRLMITSIVPRPIGWISTISKEGLPNLAPFSFFNALCGTPPLVGYCPGTRSKDFREALGSGFKDSLRNARETGEFVANMVTDTLAQQMNVTAGEYEASVNEFEMAQLTMRPSQIVRPPQVAESPISFECKVYQILEFGTETAGGSLVIGEIVCAHVDESVLRDGRIDGQLVDLVGRMGGSQYTRTRERFEMERPGVQIKRS